MFAQVACTMPNETLTNRRKHALVLGSVGAFIALFAINYIDFVKKKEENAFVAFDVKTITAGDYTIEFDLDEQFYADYLLKQHDSWVRQSAEEGREYLSDLQGFQLWIQTEMMKKLN